LAAIVVYQTFMITQAVHPKAQRYWRWASELSNGTELYFR